MQEAIPFRKYHHSSQKTTHLLASKDGCKTDDLKRIIRENAATVFIRRGCCLGIVVKCLLQGLGANPYVYEVDGKDLDSTISELEEERSVQFPAVFIGGRWFGGLDKLMAAHIAGELNPLLKQTGALWL